MSRTRLSPWTPSHSSRGGRRPPPILILLRLHRRVGVGVGARPMDAVLRRLVRQGDAQIVASKGRWRRWGLVAGRLGGSVGARSGTLLRGHPLSTNTHAARSNTATREQPMRPHVILIGRISESQAGYKACPAPATTVATFSAAVMPL
jgi:hypothetical protein